MLLLFLASTFATAPFPTPDLNLCLDDISSQLEKSGDPASDVALATVEACNVGRGEPAPGTRGADMTREAYYDLQGKIRATATTMVTKKIVRYRACKNTPGCNSSAIRLSDKSDLKPG
jgi:hypothetical protein